jgi:putative ABC transport system ATP-binding protein
VIRTRALGYRYPRGPGLSFADLEVPQGGAVLLQGRSGAGKSTWLSLAAGLLAATQGEIEVAGQALAGLSRAARDRWRAQAVGFLPQKLHLSEALTVAENLGLAYFAAGRAADHARIGEALARLGVSELAARKPSQLSGGQAQRVALARSILMRPRMLLADEPTASLDDDAAADAIALLREAALECGATLVIATHDARVREAMAGTTVYRLATSAEAHA